MATPGDFTTDWTPTKPEAPEFGCRACGSDDVWYRRWLSACGGFDDIAYECRTCGREWWIDGPDA
jgi:DNA-directed RNA polymerase subunit M/transcription elongation factor TFIIS